MQIDNVQIVGFRNIKQVDVKILPGINVIYGSNAQGKTNFLEALYMLVTGKSFRGVPDREMVPWDKGNDYVATMIRALVRHQRGTEDRYVLSFDQSQKHILINDMPLSRLGELVGRFNCVLFTPFDLGTVTGGPALRRRFLDLLISQIDAEYFYELQCYVRAMRQANVLLKQLKFKPSLQDELEPQLELMARHAGKIMCGRAEWIKTLESHAAAAYAKLSKNETETLTIAYSRSVSALNEAADAAQVSEIMRRLLTRSIQEDVAYGTISVGPHRDELVLKLNDHNAQHFASQGQQRSIVIALKQAELAILAGKKGEMPVLMLDDVLSELDEDRRHALISYLPSDVQTFITTTDLGLTGKLPQVDRVFKVANGTLVQQKL